MIRIKQIIGGFVTLAEVKAIPFSSEEHPEVKSRVIMMRDGETKLDCLSNFTPDEYYRLLQTFVESTGAKIEIIPD